VARPPHALLLAGLTLPLILAAGGPRYAPIDGQRGASPQNAAGQPLRRALAPDYADGVSALAGPDRASAREISNLVLDQEGSTSAVGRASDYLWQWGQFLDHDIDLTQAAEPAEPAPIAVPTGDPYFDPAGTGTAVIAFDRSVHDYGSPRQQRNQITGWIDGSSIYGSDPGRAAALRTQDGTGKLATSAGDLLPRNTEGLPNAGGPDPNLFVAGDVRANEQIALTAMHTLFVREHNRVVDELAAQHKGWGGERLYQQARRIVIGELQGITYQEFLPALLGDGALPPYGGYRPVDARITNAFSTAAYRFGHSALSPQIQRIGPDGASIPAGPLALRDAFFSPGLLGESSDLDPILRGLASQVCQRVDARVVDDIRNFLFGAPGAGGFDLASLNIQRGRDHGLPSYNAARAAYGFVPAASFADIAADDETQARLADAYATVDDVDLWVGGLAEPPAPGSHVGPLFHAILVEQFTALRDGDRSYWEIEFRGPQHREIAALRLADVIRRNTGIGNELQDDVFHVD